MKIEKIGTVEYRESQKDSYSAIGVNIIAETEEDQKFLDDFFRLWERTNGYMEVDSKVGRDYLKIYTSKCW